MNSTGPTGGSPDGSPGDELPSVTISPSSGSSTGGPTANTLGTISALIGTCSWDAMRRRLPAQRPQATDQGIAGLDAFQHGASVETSPVPGEVARPAGDVARLG
jgi:hypothetical protein